MGISKQSLLAALFAALAVGPALADGGGHGRGHGDRHEHGERHDRGDRHEARVIDQRIVIAEPRHARRACPPGLAKRHNGCVPPGHERVIVGQALPPGAVFVIPQRVRSTLPPAPVGYRYAVVNNQVVLVSDGNLVVDILRTLVG